MLVNESLKNCVHIYLLNGAKYDLAEWIDERLQYITGVQGAEDPTPEVQTVDILPVIHRLVCFLQSTHRKSQYLIIKGA